MGPRLRRRWSAHLRWSARRHATATRPPLEANADGWRAAPLDLYIHGHVRCPALILLAALLAPTAALATQAEDEARRGLAQYKAGAYAESAASFLRAYELSGSHTQLKNAAKAFEQASMLAEALTQWRRYATIKDLESDKRELAAAKVAALELQIAERRNKEKRALAEKAARERPTPPPPSIVPAQPAPPPVKSSNAVRWIVVGVGAAVAVTGSALYATGWTTYGQYKDDPTSVTRAQADSAELRSGIGIGVASAGLVAIAAALLWPSADSPDAEVTDDVAGGVTGNYEPAAVRF